MMHDIVHFLEQLPPVGILFALFAFSYIENIFPPSPSDVAIVFGGTFVGIGTIGFVPALLASTAGSVMGFLTAFWVGKEFGEKILERGKIKFVPIETVHKVEQWFRTYGYGIIVVNRFLSGTRAVVSFVAGMSEMDVLRTTIFCAISALAWNAILLIAGQLLGQNWTAVGDMLETYSKWVMIIGGIIVLLVVARWYFKRKKRNNAA